MSHHHDEETEMVVTHNGDNNASRHHLHTHLNLKPTVVYDRIKTKVTRKRPSNNVSTEVMPFTNNSNNNINGYNISKRTTQEQNELEYKKAFTEFRSPQIIITRRLSEQPSDRSSDNKNNELDLTTDTNENNAVVPNHVEKHEDINEPVQWRLNPYEPDIDNNQKNVKLKSKLNKVSKIPPESTNNQSNAKKRRQTARRSVQYSTKIQLHKKNARSDPTNMESSAVQQIRDEDFNNIFTDLPSDEQLIIAYPCIWRKDTFMHMHGRIFLSLNYVCFYASVLKSEESLYIAYKDIVSVTKEKSTNLVPTAIQLRTKTREQYLFASYTEKERIYIAIYRLWQNSSLEKPLDYQQLRIILNDQIGIDESTGDSEESIPLENNVDHSLDRPLHSQSMPLIPSNHPRTSSYTFTQSNEKPISTLPLDLNKESTIYLSTCPCETHLARTYADRSFAYPVDQVFELTYGNNSFTRAYHDSQKLLDYTIGEWHINTETGKRERLVVYKTVTQSIFGTNTLTCNEKQIIEVEKPGSIYVVNTEVYNEGMRYTDTFYVATRSCMFQRDAKYTCVRTTAEVRYVKSVNGIARSFIEKNCHSSVEDGVNNLMRRLEAYQTSIGDRKSGHKSIGSKHKRKSKDDGINQDVSRLNNRVLSDNQSGIRWKTNTENTFPSDMILFIGIILLFLHMYLCYKLYYIDEVLFSPDYDCLNECRKECFSRKIHS